MDSAPVVTSTNQSGQTFVIPGPISVYSQAYYKDAKGRTVAMPVSVSGDHITLATVASQPPQG